MPQGGLSQPRFEDSHPTDHRIVGWARGEVATRLLDAGCDDLVDEARVVVTELVTNALLHGGGCTGLELFPTEAGIRVEVADASRIPPVLVRAGEQSMTGRGLRLVESLSAAWGVRQTKAGKVVWAELSGEAKAPQEVDEDELLAMWGEDWDDTTGPLRVDVALGDVPTDLLLEAKAHVDNLIREFTLTAVGARTGVSANVPGHLGSLMETVGHRFAEARLSIKHQALEAARRGASHTRLELSLPVTAAEAGKDYLRALDEADAYSRAQRLLTLETPPRHRVFRRWYVQELVTQLEAAAAGKQAPAPQTFEQRLLEEIDTGAEAQRSAARAARLYAVAGALSGAESPEAVARVVLDEGVAALGASGGGMLVAADADRLEVPGTIGYGDEVLAGLRQESPDAELPAAVALRTGEPVWLVSREERDERFPQLIGVEPGTVAVCAVPLVVRGRPLGAMRFSFVQPRLFDEDERQFVLALAAQTAQALGRARLQQERVEVSSRLQRSLLPPRLPEIPQVEVAAVYHPFGTGVEVGGDFYDVWPMPPRRWGLAIGDVAGTGPEAAARSALVRYTVRALAMSEPQLAPVLRRLNDALLSLETGEEGERFCTLAFAAIATVGDEVRVDVASGGHPYPVVRRRDGHVEELVVGGSVLGLFPDVDVVTRRVVLGPGDTLVLLTDGVLDAHVDGTFFGVEGVQRVLAHAGPRAAPVAEALERAVLEHVRGELSDDMAALVLHVPG